MKNSDDVLFGMDLKIYEIVWDIEARSCEVRCSINGNNHVFKVPCEADIPVQRYGYWIEDKIGDEVGSYKCNLCGRREWFRQPYCNCGAKMEG